MRPGQLVGRGERDVRAQQRLHGQRRGDARRAGQPVGVGQDERPQRAHHLGPVEQGEALLGLEGQRLQPDLAQGDQPGHDLAVDLRVAATDERQGEMGERRQVARRADAALLGHDRVDPQPQEVEQPVDDERPAAAVAEGQRVGPQQEHRPDDLAREGRADAGGVADQEVLLEPPGVGRLDEGRGQVAEAGRHAVHHGALGDERLDDVARLLHRARGRGCRARRRRRGGRPPRRRATVRSAPVRMTGAASSGRRGSGSGSRCGTFGSVTASRIVGYPAARVRLPERPRPGAGDPAVRGGRLSRGRPVGGHRERHRPDPLRAGPARSPGSSSARARRSSR